MDRTFVASTPTLLSPPKTTTANPHALKPQIHPPIATMSDEQETKPAEDAPKEEEPKKEESKEEPKKEEEPKEEESTATFEPVVSA